jgi:mono/diheme cytochrome c family protein
MKYLTTLLLFIAQIGSASMASEPRWYTPEQARLGETVFRQNCAVCHGQNAEATPIWKERDANGFYPPPPLNGSAHAWHHDLELLRRTVREGGQKLGGLMPPFENVLSSEQIDQAIAFFQSKWPDELYQKWAGNFEIDSLPSLDDVEIAYKKSITKYLKQRIGDVDMDAVQPTTVDGIWQVKLKDRFVYLVENGEYAFIGEFIDLKNGMNLTAQQKRNVVQ